MIPSNDHPATDRLDTQPLRSNAPESTIDEERTKVKAVIRSELASMGPMLSSLADDLAEHPELGFDEHRSADAVRQILETLGFSGDPIETLPTAFRMDAGSGVHTIAFLCEYDALPEIGHACGHNLIAAIGVGAGAALQRGLMQSSLNARVSVIGTPAEEGGGGKIRLLELGTFDDVDLALMAHPAGMDLITMPSLAVAILEIETFGRAAHAAAQPQAGINALDALIGGFQAVSMLRQHVADGVRMHGIITNGGSAANVVPDYCTARFMVRTPLMADLPELVDRVRNCFTRAAEAVGATAAIRIDGEPYAEIRRWDRLETWYASNWASLGRQLTPLSEIAGVMVGSTDMGNVSQVIPSLHPMVGIGDPSLNIHTAAFAAQARTASAHQAITDAAAALAMTAVDYLCDPSALAPNRLSASTDSHAGKE